MLYDTWAVLNVLLYTQIASCLSVPSNTSSASLYPSYPATNEIKCYTPGDGREPTTVDDCRPVLKFLRTLPNYRKVQDFMEDRSPKQPSKPPYIWHTEDSNCAIQIASGNPLAVDWFSFEEARALATEILEACQAHGGLGGYAPIGEYRTGWDVKVVGYKYPPDGNETTVS